MALRCASALVLVATLLVLLGIDGPAAAVDVAAMGPGWAPTAGAHGVHPRFRV
jgi:hypothetical protein